MADKFLTVDFCCNDGHNGAFQGWFDGIEVENSRGDRLKGDCLMLDEERAPSIKFDSNTATVNGTKYPKRGGFQGRGNWCWTSVSMTVGDTIALLRQLKRIGFWFEDDSPSDFVELAGVMPELGDDPAPATREETT